MKLVRSVWPLPFASVTVSPALLAQPTDALYRFQA